jgi:hypothetical protein
MSGKDCNNISPFRSIFRFLFLGFFCSLVYALR